MKRNEVLQIRLTTEEKEILKRLAGKQSLSDYVREELNLEPVVGHGPPPTKEEFTKAAQTTYDAIKSIELTKLIKQLEAQGNPEAEEVARKRLGM